jgi:hypothetical protein
MAHCPLMNHYSLQCLLLADCATVMKVLASDAERERRTSKCCHMQKRMLACTCRTLEADHVLREHDPLLKSPKCYSYGDDVRERELGRARGLRLRRGESICINGSPSAQPCACRNGTASIRVV